MENLHTYAATMYCNEFEGDYDSPTSEPLSFVDSPLLSDCDATGSEDVSTTDEFLIQLVKGYPFLYNKQSKDFKDAGMKDNAWVEIAASLNLSALECSARWLRLRQYYTKERLKRQKETRTGSGKSKRKKWILFDHMSFLDDHALKRKTFGNFGNVTSTDGDRHVKIGKVHSVELIDKESPTSEINKDKLKESMQKDIIGTPNSRYLGGRKRKANADPIENAFLQMNQSFQVVADKVASNIGITEDEDTLFGKLVAAELKKMPQEKKEILKRKILLDLYS